MDLIINLNKPKGITSHKTTAKVQKILGAGKAGHTGTLDPSATGVLLVCINSATRLAQYFTSLDKGYTAVMKLGETTDTQDADGKVTAKSDSIDVDEVTVRKTLKSFEGTIQQIPPIYSALKYKGKPLYKYAQKGIKVPIESRAVNIYHIELTGLDLPFVSFKTLCSKGTYIRTLCNDIGMKLGIGAHLYSLERTSIGPFNVSDSISIEDLPPAGPNLFSRAGVYPMDKALSWMPEITIRESMVKGVKNGMPIAIGGNDNFVITPGIDCKDLNKYNGIKIKSPDGKFLAVGSFSSRHNSIIMDVVFGN